VETITNLTADLPRLLQQMFGLLHHLCKILAHQLIGPVDVHRGDVQQRNAGYDRASLEPQEAELSVMAVAERGKKVGIYL
jgi:hypothetical protein